MISYRYSYLFIALGSLLLSQNSFGMLPGSRKEKIAEEIVTKNEIAKKFTATIINNPKRFCTSTKDMSEAEAESFMLDLISGNGIKEGDPQLLTILIAQCADSVSEATLKEWLALDIAMVSSTKGEYLEPIKEIAHAALEKIEARKKEIAARYTNDVRKKNAADTTKWVNVLVKAGIATGIALAIAAAYYTYNNSTETQEAQTPESLPELQEATAQA